MQDLSMRHPSETNYEKIGRWELEDSEYEKILPSPRKACFVFRSLNLRIWCQDISFFQAYKIESQKLEMNPSIRRSTSGKDELLTSQLTVTLARRWEGLFPSGGKVHITAIWESEVTLVTSGCLRWNSFFYITRVSKTKSIANHLKL